MSDKSFSKFFFILITLFSVGFFIYLLTLTQLILAQFRISVLYQVSVRSQYLARFFSLCWITSGHSIYSPIEGLLPLTRMEPTPFLNSASKVAGLQGHATTPGYKNEAWPLITNQNVKKPFRNYSLVLFYCCND